MHHLTRLLGVELPIVQAPMAGVQGGALAAAVSGAGGLGSIPCAMLDANAVRGEVALVRERTPAPFNLNFFCHQPPEPDAEREARWRALLAPYYEELGIDPAANAAGASRTPFDETSAALLEELRPAVVSFHFGLPSPELLARVRATRARILSSATTVDEARWLESHGVDAIIAQGAEAGGHRGMFLTRDASTQIGTFALVPQIARAVRVPVIAAGGIADADGVAAALSLGAAGVQVGTSYLLCPEATTSAPHRAALSGDAARETALTNLFSGGPARGIVNRLMREIGPMSEDLPAFPLASAALAPLRAAAERAGRGDFSPLWAGQNASGCSARPAAELTRALMPAPGRTS
ncbi:MAG TPA: nitronate monooxygenase [Gemmatimonadaceae bacterium]|nr:nitronate monooxygenase [Gemmatimonadaceae bacterium]